MELPKDSDDKGECYVFRQVEVVTALRFVHACHRRISAGQGKIKRVIRCRAKYIILLLALPIEIDIIFRHFGYWKTGQVPACFVLLR
jgi:hypothetical protein